jgi:hypothetical protein
MAFTDDDYLADIVQAILDAIDAALTDAGRPPDRVIRTDGDPVLDCGGLYGHVSEVGLVDTGLDRDFRPVRQAVRLGAAVVVTLARCRAAVPDSQSGVPPAAAVDEDAVGMHTDLWVTQRALIDSVRDGSLGAGGTCTVARLNPVTPIPPAGGIYGVTTTIELALG